MRIALLTTFFPPDALSGIARYVEDLALGLVANGHEVVVIATSSKRHETDTSIEDRDGYKIHWIFDSMPFLLKIFPSFNMLWASLKIRTGLVNLHKEKPFEIVEFPNTEYPALVSVLIRLPTPLPKFVLRLSSPRACFKKTYRTIRISEILEKLQACLSDGIIGNSKSNFNLCQNIYGFSETLPNRLILHDLPHGTKPFSAKPLSKKDNVLRIFFLGRMEDRKGFDILAKAWPRISLQIPTSQLIVAGEDLPYENEPSFFSWAIKGMPTYALDRLEYRGVVGLVERELLYQQCDVCVIPSRYESFGLTSLEAMRYGKPVISCNAGGIPEVVQHGITGLLVPVDDDEALSHALIKILQDTDFRQQLGKNALADVNKRFNVGRMVNETVDFYSSLLKTIPPS
ncbi:glycosyltransferase family 4 protein [Methylococcaceae bacterium WWC4]|nr:glycosyltransferase family 4 protein [Methylococcaceae bacterium WWC4]